MGVQLRFTNHLTESFQKHIVFLVTDARQDPVILLRNGYSLVGKVKSIFRVRLRSPVVQPVAAITALVCNLCCTLPASGSLLPLNAITPVIGAPVVIYVILKRR